MLDKIVISTDRHSARVYFATHFVDFYSDGDVLLLLQEAIFESSFQVQASYDEKQRRELSSLEDTQVLEEIQPLLKDIA